jgi:leucyl-tRNA synthetase
VVIVRGRGVLSDYRSSAKEFEARWQREWERQDVYRTPNPGDPDFDPSREKYVVLDFFPYPSGIGLHIGHPLGYVATDVMARFMRMRGYSVLHSMGFDSFGLPAEQYAIQTGQHPRVTTDENIRNMLAQLQRLGFGHDPHRRFSTTDAEYYRWTQWIFLRLFHAYYDPEARWTGPDGHENVGRARPITELAERLRSGGWVLTDVGVPVPSHWAVRGHRASESELSRALDQARLAYVEEVPVNWCPMLGTVLSNEEITNEGRSERGNHPVYRRPLRQWILRITAYAERLLDDLQDIDWPHGIAQMQRDWIGRSEGASIDFPATTSDGEAVTITVYTTRADTLFGATFIVLAPGHPLVKRLTTPDRLTAVAHYQAATARISGLRAEDTDAPKTGIFTGAYASHPVTGKRLPIWIADYVLLGYGSGALMAVPAHDSRDLAFARAFDLPVHVVVEPPDAWLIVNAPPAVARDPAMLRAYYHAHPEAFSEAYSAFGVGVNSSASGISLDGLATPEAQRSIVGWLEAQGSGRVQLQYRLRDWLFSRQRYWGEPFPVVHDSVTGQVYALNDEDLPVLLPELTDFMPVMNQAPDSPPDPPLARATDWIHVNGIVLEDGTVHLVSETPVPRSVTIQGRAYPLRAFHRDANTMPNWAGSCWYYLRYFDPHNEMIFVGREAEKYWSLGQTRKLAGAVDLYMGGAEHAVLHLLYARFWHKVLYDLSWVSTREPFQKLFNQGMITADAYHDARGVYVDVHDVEIRTEDGQRVAYSRVTGERLITDPGKMGKRYKNGVPPEEVCDQYTVDTFRVYEMFMGPLEATKPWQADAIIGVLRFLRAVWDLALDEERRPRTSTVDPAVDRLVHKAIKKVTEDIGHLRMNTAIAAMMELVNVLARQPTVHPDHVRTLVLLVSPFAPHLAEEVIYRLAPAEHRARRAVIHFDWPRYDAAKCVDDRVEVPIQINGVRRSAIVVPLDVSEAQLEALVRADEKVRRHTEGKVIQRVIAVLKPRPTIVNLVVR